MKNIIIQHSVCYSYYIAVVIKCRTKKHSTKTLWRKASITWLILESSQGAKSRFEPGTFPAVQAGAPSVELPLNPKIMAI